MHGPRGACTGVLRGERDTVGPRRAADWEGREVVRVRRRSPSKTSSEREELVSDPGAGGCVVATDVNDREAAAEGARGEGAVEGGCVSEEA